MKDFFDSEKRKKMFEDSESIISELNKEEKKE